MQRLGLDTTHVKQIPHQMIEALSLAQGGAHQFILSLFVE